MLAGLAGARAQQELHYSPITLIDPGGPYMTLGETGVVYLLEFDFNQQDTCFRRSDDFGKTFGAPLRIADYGRNQLETPLHADHLGHILGAWTNQLTSFVTICTSRDAGETWSSMVHQPDPVPGRRTDLEIFGLVDEGGRMYVAHESDDCDPPVRTTTWFTRSLDGGLTFEAAQTIGYDPNHPSAVGLSELVADGEGMVYAAFVGRPDEESPWEIFVQASCDYGGSWGPRSVVQTFSTTGTSSIRIATSGHGIVHAVWGSNGDLFLSRSIDGGTTFESPVRLDTHTPPGERSNFNWDITADTSGNVYVAWMDEGVPVANVSHDFGATWEGVQTIGVIGDDRLEIDCNQTGHVAVSWSSFSDGLGFNTSRDFGETWLPERVVLNSGLQPFAKPTEIDGAGRVAACWEDAPDGFRRFRTVFPTLGVSIDPRDDGDGVVIIPPEGDRLVVDIQLRNHHPTDPIEDLTVFLEAQLPSGNVIGPLTMPRTIRIPLDQRRKGTLRANFGSSKPPGLYHLIVTTEGPIPDSVRLPIIKR
jgi:hypothetical protein